PKGPGRPCSPNSIRRGPDGRGAAPRATWCRSAQERARRRCGRRTDCRKAAASAVLLPRHSETTSGTQRRPPDLTCGAELRLGNPAPKTSGMRGFVAARVENIWSQDVYQRRRTVSGVVWQRARAIAEERRARGDVVRRRVEVQCRCELAQRRGRVGAQVLDAHGMEI